MTGAIAAAIIGYGLGSVPWGLVLSRLGGYGDIRHIGSGNTGATNVLRTGSKTLAGLTLAFDIFKGTAAVLIGGIWGQDAALVAGGAVLIGHMFPVWLGFRGGKGVATAFGVFITIAWPVALGGAAVWLVVALAFQYSSLAALVAAVVSAGSASLVVEPKRAIFIAAVAILVVARHRENDHRLLAGTETRISFRKV